MVGISTPFGGDDGGGELFDSYDEFVPTNVPEPGRFLEGHDLLAGTEHCAFHGLTRELFEERSVYDMTFGYNLARLNLDTRHRNAGYRYAREANDPSILRAEFTPTTPFCPQSDTLTKGSFRAWNSLSDRHEYDLVRVRVDGMHHRADEINDELAAMEDSVDELQEDATDDDGETANVTGQRQGGSGCSQGTGGSSRGYGDEAPF